ncbi:MAG TPA: TonB-dependent receptor [Steroidobacteraceae bacterium]|nr:TonB-dependent receptor [Steroidobacteraceae bacterium]
MPLRIRETTTLGLAITAVLTAAQAPAQTAPADPSALPEVVVTARQRAERIEDVPATVQAFTDAQIVSAGIERPQDFIALTPNVSQVQTAEAGDMQVVIRGINTGRDAETNFALVVDGVLQTNPNALNQELNDVTQIEVLKGPQGALYGRNALAGAIIMTTRKPPESAAFEVGAGYGSDNSYKGNLYLGGPIGETTKGSLSLYTRSTDGQWDNTLLGCDDCVDYFEESGAIGRLTFQAGSGEIDVKAKYSTIESGAINFNAAVSFFEAAAIFGAPPFDEDPNQHNFFYTNNIIPKNEQDNLNFSIKGDWDVGVGTFTSVLAYNDQTNFFLTDGASDAFYLYALTPSCAESFAARTADTPLPPPFNYGTPPGTILSFTPYASSFQPPYGPTTCGGYQYQQRDQEDMSLELRLTSPGDQRFRWVAGVYFADIERHVIVSQGSDNTGDSLQQDFLARGFVPASGPNPTDLLYDDTFDSKVYAGFGQLAYDMTEGVEIALALRYDSEKREVDNNVPTGPTDSLAQTPLFAAIYGPTPFINPAYTVNPAFATDGIPSRSRTYEQFQPKLSLNWKTSDDVAFYASYGYGFRSGGFNSSGSEATVNVFYGGLCLGPSTPFDAGFATLPLGLPACTADSTRNLSEVHDDYRKEVSKAAELGFKSTFLDRRLAINGALFHTDVEDMQFFDFMAGPFGLLRVVTNLDEVTIQGAELDFTWRANEYFSLFGGYGYTDGEIDRYDVRPYTAGNNLPYAPEYTGNLGAELTLPMGGSGLELVARLDGTFVGETWFHPVQDETVPNLPTAFGFGQGNYSKQKRDPYEVMNARLTLRGERWSATAWSRNLLDEEYLQEAIVAPEFGGAFIHDSPGRSYGLDIKYSFR